ncbi:hypothetical protein BJX63DRAFT_58293 [Aspergillus granulosus]|uniref:Uncharacterized protein n=1 Tax=Aspergillus granulosus TaxID=176169 RepID=A0ABR4HT05_9EURO
MEDARQDLIRPCSLIGANILGVGRDMPRDRPSPVDARKTRLYSGKHKLKSSAPSSPKNNRNSRKRMQTPRSSPKRVRMGMRRLRRRRPCITVYEPILKA